MHSACSGGIGVTGLLTAYLVLRSVMSNLDTVGDGSLRSVRCFVCLFACSGCHTEGALALLGAFTRVG